MSRDNKARGRGMFTALAATTVVAAWAIGAGPGGSGLGVPSAKAQAQPCEPQIIDTFEAPPATAPEAILEADENNREVARAEVGLAGVVAGARDRTLRITAPPFPLAAGAGLTVGGIPDQDMGWSNNVNTASEAAITWDGPDGDAAALNATGLGGVDYSGAGSSGVFSFEIVRWDRDDVGASFTLAVYTSASAASTQTVTVTPQPDLPPAPGTRVEFPISGFTPSVGSGADFASVGAIVLSMALFDAGAGEATALDMALDNVMGPCPRAQVPPPPAAEPPGRPNLQLDKRAGRDRVRAGGKVGWVLKVRNRGDARAKKVRLCDRLHRRLTVVNRRGGELVNGSRVCWTIRRIPPGERKRRSLVVRVDRDAPKGQLANHAFATSEDSRRRRARASVRVTRVKKDRPEQDEPSPVTG